MSYYSIKDKEGTIINNVAAEFFADYDCRKLIGNIDFSVAIPQTGKELFPEIEYVLWAEAKMGVKHKLYESFIQLILTIGRERTIDKVMPPKFLGAFDAEKIAFIPFSAIREIFNQNDFNWNVTPSDHSTKEFAQLKQMVQSELARTNKEKDNVFVFDYFTDKRDLKKFIARNFVSGRDSIQRMRITYNNFTHIYEKWCREVKPSIAVDWENVKKTGLLDADFYLADIMSGDNNTLLENLHVLLKSNHYELDRKVDTYGFVSSSSVPFYDNMVAHSTFWAKYSRPPKKEYWDKIVERRDLLVPQDIRERKGSYFTPRIWVEKSQEYLADVLGEDWQAEYYIWDCCAGTGNLLAGLTNKYNIWASTLDKADVDVMHERIENMGENSNLLKSHVFQFDFLNGDFDQLPEGLQEIINDEEKRKKLVIYINPPYVETAGKRSGINNSKIRDWRLEKIALALREIYVQFITRIYQEIPGVTLAEFSTLKILQAANFVDFRNYFLAKLEKMFIVPADTFDNVKGKFPIGFKIWNTSIKEKFNNILTDVYLSDGSLYGPKMISCDDVNLMYFSKWVIVDKEKRETSIAWLEGITRNDFQGKNKICLLTCQSPNNSQPRGVYVGINNLSVSFVGFAVRHCIEATWLNDRDQFLYPSDGWRYDKDFQNDCLAYTLFHGQNRITSEFGDNHWIPFTEQQVKAPDNFKSHFMSDFIAGKLAPKDAETLFGAEENLIPTEPIQFTPIAQAVMEAGRKIWEYYMSQKPKIYGAEPINVNASFYDIRVYFQGRDDKGKMRSDSEDQTYMSLLRDLRNNQKILAKQIEKKVYLYGFLKGEVEVSAQELAAELKETQKEIISLRKQLQSQHAAQVVNYGTININDNSKNIKF